MERQAGEEEQLQMARGTEAEDAVPRARHNTGLGQEVCL